MKNNKEKIQFHIHQLLALACLAALTFSACGKSEANKADEPNVPDQVSQQAVSGQSTQEAAGEQISQETGDEQTTSEAADVQTTQEVDAAYEQISQEEAKNLMDTEPDAIILDVRTEEEYASGHIAGAICIPNETIDENITDQLPDKDQLILVYCRSGNRSKQASEKLVALGYTNIKEFGGINTWPYEIE